MFFNMLGVVVFAFVSCCLILLWMGYTLTIFHDNKFINRSGFGLDVAHVFNLHPTLMVLGFVGCNFMAITVFHYLSDSSYNPLAKKKLHMGLQTAALVFAVLGTIAVFRSHNAATPPIQNMYSMHSWIGLLTIIAFAIQYFIGLISFYYPRLNEQTRRSVLPKHRFVGIVLVVSIVAAVISGIQEKLGFNGTCNVAVEADDDHDRLLSSRGLHAGHKTGHTTADCMFGVFIGVFIYVFAVFALYKALPSKGKDRTHEEIDERLDLEEFEGLTMSIE